MTYTPRQLLAAIALAELPVPSRVSFQQGRDGRPPLLSLDFLTVADGERWTVHLDADEAAYLCSGRRWLGSRGARWHGWTVVFHASDPVLDGGDLDPATVADLQAVTG